MVDYDQPGTVFIKYSSGGTSSSGIVSYSHWFMFFPNLTLIFMLFNPDKQVPIIWIFLLAAYSSDCLAYVL